MTLFLGYDPGGRNSHGVAAAYIMPDGTFKKVPVMDVLESAKDVRDWVVGFSDVAAVGIDTLLAWSLTGSRQCDEVLRKSYPEHTQSIIAQNSLYSSMTLNGAMIAKECSDLGLPIVESHPKLLIKTNVAGDPEGHVILGRYHSTCSLPATSKKDAKRNDDKADALVAAWCASRWYFKRWTENLFAGEVGELVFPAGDAEYPWPCALG